MSYEPINIMPYKPQLEADIRESEKKAARGNLVKLEIIRESYISRAKVFQCHGSYLGYNEKGQLVGAVTGTKVPLKINGHEFKAGFGLDLYVIPSWKNKGVGKQLSNYVVRNFFHQHNLTRNFITLRVSNNPLMRSSLKSMKKYSSVDFTYLVIPTQARIIGQLRIDQPVSFSTELMEKDNRLCDYVSRFNGGLCVWHTHRLYRHRIMNIHPIAKLSTMIISLLNRKRYPSKGDEIKTATIFNLNNENIIHINQALECLEKDGVNYLNIVCKKNDPVYTQLKPYSMFTYDHYMLADFSLHPTDKITIDVRCL